MKKLYIFSVVCILLMFSGCKSKELPELANNSVYILRKATLTCDGDVDTINAYPKIDLNNITGLPVYKSNVTDINPLYQKVIELESEYANPNNEYKREPPYWFDWKIFHNQYEIAMKNYLYMIGTEQITESYIASNNGFNMYFYDILQEYHSGLFPFPFDSCPPAEINESISCDEAVNKFKESIEEHIAARNLIYPENYSYCDYKYHVICRLDNCRGLILNFRPKKLSSDKDILLDYFDLCNKVSFEINWFKPKETDTDNENYKPVSLYINNVTTANYEYLGDYDLITADEAAEKFKKKEDVFYTSDTLEGLYEEVLKSNEYDEIYLVYIADESGFIRPVYMAIKDTAIGKQYIKWTDAIKNKYIYQKEDN